MERKSGQTGTQQENGQPTGDFFKMVKDLKKLYDSTITRTEMVKGLKLAGAQSSTEISDIIDTAEKAKSETAGRFAEIIKNYIKAGVFNKKEKKEAMEFLTTLESRELTGLSLYAPTNGKE